MAEEISLSDLAKKIAESAAVLGITGLGFVVANAVLGAVVTLL